MASSCLYLLSITPLPPNNTSLLFLFFFCHHLCCFSSVHLYLPLPSPLLDPSSSVYRPSRGWHLDSFLVDGKQKGLFEWWAVIMQMASDWYCLSAAESGSPVDGGGGEVCCHDSDHFHDCGDLEEGRGGEGWPRGYCGWGSLFTAQWLTPIQKVYVSAHLRW